MTTVASSPFGPSLLAQPGSHPDFHHLIRGCGQGCMSGGFTGAKVLWWIVLGGAVCGGVWLWGG